jgi:flagellar biosynthesis/type III secretory pathway chaperone
MQHSTHSYSQAVASAAAEIESRIRALLPLLDTLERALNVEAEALASRDAQALLSAVETKRQGLRSLEAALAETNLAALVESLANQSARNGADASALRGSHSWLKNELFAAAVPSWQPLLERLRRCRSLNQAAGGSTAALQRHTQEGLRLLGLAPDPCMYGVSGRTDAPVSALKPVVA